MLYIVLYTNIKIFSGYFPDQLFAVIQTILAQLGVKFTHSCELWEGNNGRGFSTITLRNNKATNRFM
jgi:hypothetical protein